jgi:hypothetical protein
MQENNKSETPEYFSENEEPLPNREETTTQENLSSSEPRFEEQGEETASQENLNSPESGFEEQEGELLLPDEKKNYGTGKVFLLLILLLAGLGGYLYFNNLIPSKILNIIFQKSAPSMPPALITQTPSFIEETPVILETPKSYEVVETTIPKPTTILPKPPETQEIHISGHAPIPTLSGNDFGQTTIKQEAHISGYKPKPTISGEGFGQPTIEEKKQGTPVPGLANLIQEKELILEQKSIEIPMTEPILASDPNSQGSGAPLRGKAVQAYLDFIESTIEKLVELTKECFEISWSYLKEKLSSLNLSSNKL